jgi:hypothetical protein
MSVQTSVLTQAAAAIAGQVHDGANIDIISRVASASTPQGVVAIRGTSDLLGRALATGDTPADDDDAIIASGVASTTGAQILSGATLNGVTGVSEIWPPRNVTLTFNSHADWDLTTAVVEGLDSYGAPCQETFLVPNGGNIVLTGTICFSRVLQVRLMAQTGTNGTLKVGTGTKIGAIDRKVLGIVMYDRTRMGGSPYAQYEDMPIVQRGKVWVTAEAAVTEGDEVYVRFVVTGDEQYGGLRGAPDSTDCGLVRRARWASTTTGAGLAVVELL